MYCSRNCGGTSSAYNPKPDVKPFFILSSLRFFSISANLVKDSQLSEKLKTLRVQSEELINGQQGLTKLATRLYAEILPSIGGHQSPFGFLLFWRREIRADWTLGSTGKRNAYERKNTE